MDYDRPGVTVLAFLRVAEEEGKAAPRASERRRVACFRSPPVRPDAADRNGLACFGSEVDDSRWQFQQLILSVSRLTIHHNSEDYVMNTRALSLIALTLLLAPPARGDTPSTEVVAWKLGSQFNLAAVLSYRGKDPEVAKQVYAKAQELAALAKVEIPPLPEKINLPRLLTFLDQANQGLEKKIAKLHGAQAERLYEIASMSVVVLLVYEFGGATINKQFSEGIAERAMKAELPEKLWQPVVKMIREKGKFDDLKAAVLTMHDQVAEHLAAKVGR